MQDTVLSFGQSLKHLDHLLLAVNILVNQGIQFFAKGDQLDGQVPHLIRDTWSVRHPVHAPHGVHGKHSHSFPFRNLRLDQLIQLPYLLKPSDNVQAHSPRFMFVVSVVKTSPATPILALPFLFEGMMIRWNKQLSAFCAFFLFESDYLIKASHRHHSFSMLIGVPTVPTLPLLSVALKNSPGIGYIYRNMR